MCYTPLLSITHSHHPTFPSFSKSKLLPVRITTLLPFYTTLLSITHSHLPLSLPPQSRIITLLDTIAHPIDCHNRVFSPVQNSSDTNLTDTSIIVTRPTLQHFHLIPWYSQVLKSTGSTPIPQRAPLQRPACLSSAAAHDVIRYTYFAAPAAPPAAHTVATHVSPSEEQCWCSFTCVACFFRYFLWYFSLR